MKNYYEILEVSKTASKEVIEKVYKVLAKKYHPDMHQGNDKIDAEEKFKEVSEAYEILMDDDKRKKYDAELGANELNINEAKIVHDTEYIYVDKNDNSSNDEEIQNELKNQIEYEKQKAYNDAYIKSLKDMGYNIVYKKTLKEYLKSVINLIIFIVVIVIICLLPPVNNILKAWYESSPEFIKTFIESLFK